MSFARYLEVVHTIWHKISLTRTKVVLAIVGVWVFGSCYKLTIALPLTRVTGPKTCVIGATTKSVITPISGFFALFGESIVPMFLIALCYIAMAGGKRCGCSFS